jgi:hypothetical protein
MSDEQKLKLASVVVLPVITTLDIDVQRVLNAAVNAELERAIVIGRTADGELYFASSKSGGGEILWDLETARLRLMESL